MIVTRDELKNYKYKDVKTLCGKNVILHLFSDGECQDRIEKLYPADADAIPVGFKMFASEEIVKFNDIESIEYYEED